MSAGPTLDALSTLDTIATRLLDTAEDALLLARRVKAEPVGVIDCLAAWDDASDTRPRVLVIGSGWAAHALVKIVDADLYRLLVVSPRTFFIFTPMLASSSVGTVEYRSIAEPMRESNPRAAFVEGTITDIDPMRRTAQLKIGSTSNGGVGGDGQAAEPGVGSRSLEYDICCFACGVQSRSPRVPGVAEHCMFLKEITDAQALRRAVSGALEEACRPGLSEEERRRILTLLVVGGGATGVEYCAELSDFLSDVLGRLYPQLQPFARVLLLHSGPELLPQFDNESGQRERALRSLQARGVEVRLETRVEEVFSPSRLRVQRRAGGGSADGSAWESRELGCGLVMWAAGTGPTPLTERLLSRLADGAADGDAEFGRPAPLPSAFSQVPVDPWLRVIGTPAGSLLALGDAALCVGTDGSALPQTAQAWGRRTLTHPLLPNYPNAPPAQVAAQQGAFVARMLNRGYDLRGASGGKASDESAAPPHPAPPVSAEAAGGDVGRWLALRGAVESRQFEFLNLGLLAYLGGGEALSQVQVGEQRLLSEAGSTGFLLWRSVYVVKQVSTRTRVLVLFDWLKSQLFGRDVTRW
jgi:NADH dehydrogenase FAD-containing subunit